MTVVSPSTGARVRRNALTAIQTRVLTDSWTTIIERKKWSASWSIGQSMLVNCCLGQSQALTFAYFSITLITLLTLALVTARCIIANCILATQMLFCGALINVCLGREKKESSN